MELSKKEIKALASDTRVAMLKSLGGRRKMPSELARELSMAPSTIVEHLRILQRTGMVRRIDTGHKWKYYELTSKGRNLVKPKFPVQFVVMLSLGAILIFGSLASLLATGIAPLRAAAAESVEAGEALGAEAPRAMTVVDPTMNAIGIILLILMVVGVILISVALVKFLWSRRK